MKNKKYSLTLILRHIIQILSFLIYPGLFIIILNSIKTIIKILISGTFEISQMYPQLMALLAVIPITIIWGRFFCGYLCAFGSMQEFINIIARKIKIKQIKVKKEVDEFLKKLKYVILIILIILWLLDISITSINPWNVFGIYSSYKGWNDLSHLFTIGGLILLIIIIVSIFIERAFCRYFCPLGGIFAITSKFRLFKIKKNKTKCLNCNLCTNKCPMGIDVNRQTNIYDKVTSGECIDCFKCIEKCNPKSLYTTTNKAIIGTTAAIAIAGLYYAGTITNIDKVTEEENDNTQIETNIDENKTIEKTPSKYIDGIYEGTGTGYRGNIKAKVVVENGNISSITIEEYMDDDQFFNQAKSNIINKIIYTQSTNVSTVTGATYSSKGIIEAVSNALNIVNEEKQEEIEREEVIEQEDVTEENEKIEVVEEIEKMYKDGTYIGTGKGRNGNIEVSVTVKSGRISSITIESSNEDAPYFSRAKEGIIDSIIENQSINVQTVSGATMSSNGIIEAVANALDISFDNPNGQMPSGGHGRMR